MINFLQEIADNSLTSSGESVSIVNLLEQFLFPRTTHGTLIAKLSGGEKKRLYLLKILLQQPNVLLLDEPTNDLDIATLTVLENFIQHYKGVVITVSHDRYFLDKVVKQVAAVPVVQVNDLERARMTYSEKQEWSTIEASISSLETDISTIEQQMAVHGSDFTKLGELQAALDLKNNDLLDKYERYEYLAGFD